MSNEESAEVAVQEVPQLAQEEEQKSQEQQPQSKQKNKEDLFKANKRPEQPRAPSRLFQPPNPEERELKRKEYLDSTPDDYKEQLCRFWLRGLCMFSKDICKYAHGIEDLIFKRYNNEVLDFDGKIKDYNQKALWIEAKPSYVNVYEYQFKVQDKLERIYSQEEIDTDRKIRAFVREFQHTESLVNFYKLLLKTYPDQAFSESFVEREYNRVGFNKIGFKLKYQYILGALSGVAFEGKSLIDPTSKKPVSVIIPLPADILDRFKKTLLDICKAEVKSDGFPIMESSLRKIFYSRSSPTEPALHQIMNILNKKSFKDYLEEIKLDEGFQNELLEGLSDEEKSKAKSKVFGYDSEMEKVKESASAFLLKSTSHIFNLSRWEDTIIEEFEQNVKAFGSFSKFKFYFRSFLITQKVFPVRTSTCDYALKYQPKTSKKHPVLLSHCKCEPQKIEYVPKEVSAEIKEKYEEKRIVVVDCKESLAFAAQTIRSFKEIGIDLEGHLRKEGYIQLVQISGMIKPGISQIFVFDVYFAQYVSVDKSLGLEMKQYIQGLMQDESVLKIFHDCRHDSLALHRFLGACPKNVFDTAAVHSLRQQIEKYIGLEKDDFKVLRAIEELKMPGLNEVLLSYNARHGINKQKDEMHRKFQELPGNFFLQRPIREDFLEYSARDVEDLVEVYHCMVEKFQEVSLKAFPQANEEIIREWIHQVSESYVEYGFEQSK